MAKQSAEDFLAHHGILGMHWGQHKAKPQPTPTQQLDTLQRQRNKIDANKAIAGYGASGYQMNKMYKRELKKNPSFAYNKLSPEEQASWRHKAANRANTRSSLDGAATAAVILGVGGFAISKLSSSTKMSGKIGLGLLVAQVGYMTVSQIHAVNSATKLDDSFAKTAAIRKSMKSNGK